MLSLKPITSGPRRDTATAPESGLTLRMCGGSVSSLPPGGGSFLAQPAVSQAASASTAAASAPARRLTGKSQNVASEAGTLERRLELLAHVLPGHADLLLAALGHVEQHVFEQGRDHCVQAPRADVLHLLVHPHGDLRDFVDGLVVERELDAVGGEQRLVLLDQRVL